MAVLHNGMRVVTKEPNEGLWFRHESYYDVSTLHPVSYELLKTRKGLAAMEMRRRFDNHYRQHLPHHPDYTYLFATVVGGNMMEDPFLFTGFTYYFQLSNLQIEQGLYTIIDETKWMEPTLGLVGLNKALEIWSSFNHLFSRPGKKGHEMIYPRIEVVLPIAVQPEIVIPQFEDR